MRDEGQLPTLSIITVAKNCGGLLRECYGKIAAQDYPADKIELLLIDGGSADDTKSVAKSFGARVIDGGFPDNQEARRYVGFQSAHHDILVYIDADNFLPDTQWLKKMVLPFMSDVSIIATQTYHYGYDRKYSPLNRYFGLIGANDPVAFYLGKADRAPWYSAQWSQLGDLMEETPDYFKVRFRLDDFPTIGCNGFLVRRAVFSQLTCQAHEFLHTDIFYDLIQKGYDTFAIVKTSIFHISADSFFSFMKKRIRYMRMHHHKMGEVRRYRVFDRRRPRDIKKLGKFILFAGTFIRPCWDAMKGYRRIRDAAWFLHPVVCFGFLCAYGLSCMFNFLQPPRGK
ncbi:MAG: glycosyltransferase family 2 protein [Candidatus Omnitrophica bacterium]|nr:glycosyltransferase family 2 protein [Candidatus Omnitrophota bacterium]